MLALAIFLTTASMISPALGQTVTELVTTTSTATSTVLQTTATTILKDVTDNHTRFQHKFGMPIPAFIVLLLGAVLTIFGIPLVMFASRFVRARAQRKQALKKKMSGSSLGSSDTSSSNVDLEKGVVSPQNVPELASSSSSTSGSASTSPAPSTTTSLPADAFVVRMRYDFRAEARVAHGELPAAPGQIVSVLQWEGVEAEDGTNQWFIGKDLLTGDSGLIPKAFVTPVSEL